MSLQVNIFLLLFGGLQGLLFSYFLIRKKANRSANLFLVFYIGVMILQVVLKAMSKVWLMEHLQPLYSLSYLFPFLYGPLAFLFTVHRLDAERKPGRWAAIHFIPFGLSLAALLADLVLRGRSLPGVWFLDHRINIVWHSVSILGYHLLALAEWNKAAGHKHSMSGVLSSVQSQWLRRFIIASMVVSLTITFAIYFMYIYYPSLNALRWVFIGPSLFIYWISFTAISQHDVFTVVRGGALQETVSMQEPRLLVHRPARRYHNSGLSEEEARRIDESLQRLFDAGKLYLDPDITIDQLAQKLSCSRHHLSQVLNEIHRQSFYEFINHRRVAEAKSLLSNPDVRLVKIASIAFDSGFKSISTFNEVFKKLTGQTPSQYRDQSIPAAENRAASKIVS